MESVISVCSSWWPPAANFGIFYTEGRVYTEGRKKGNKKGNKKETKGRYIQRGTNEYIQKETEKNAIKKRGADAKKSLKTGVDTHLARASRGAHLPFCAIQRLRSPYY